MRTSQPVLGRHALDCVMLETQVEGVELSPEVKEAMAAQEKRAVRQPDRSKSKVPDWVQSLIEQNADPAAFVGAVLRRGLERRDRATLEEVLAVLNEIGHDRASAAEVTRSITADVLNQLNR